MSAGTALSDTREEDMYFLIEESLRQVSREELRNTDRQYAAVLSFDEWRKSRDSFETGQRGRFSLSHLLSHRDLII